MLLAGLLHGIGKLILADNVPREYKRVVKEAKEAGSNLVVGKRQYGVI